MPEKQQIVTQRAPENACELWRYIEDSIPAFNPECFDEHILARKNLVDGLATAGRGNTVFFTLENKPLVLRHYRRGGLVRHISEAHYVYTGMSASRALREFDMLVYLQSLSLPAPLPYACRVQRKGLLYKASLITYRLPGNTLAQCISDIGSSRGQDHALGAQQWSDLGKTIAGFHAAGIYHADLNAHNIIIENSQRIALLDFDRSCIKRLPKRPAESGWCHDNMKRLLRSIKKLAINNNLTSGFDLCEAQWRHSLTNPDQVSL